MSESECSIQIKKAVADAIEFLSEEKQKELITSVCDLIKAQRCDIRENPESPEALAIKTCGIDDDALAEQERILEEVITKHNIERAHHNNYGLLHNN